MSSGTPEDDRWDDDALNEIWRDIQESQGVHKSNGVDGLGAVLEKVGSLAATMERYTQASDADREAVRARLKNHSLMIKGPEAAAERLAQLQGMVARSFAQGQALGEVVTSLAAQVERARLGVESLQYWLWAVLVLLAAVGVVGLLK